MGLQQGIRRVQIGFVVLLAVCVAQVGWWIIDQWIYTAEVEDLLARIYANELHAADMMFESGTPVAEILERFPDLEIKPSPMARPSIGASENAPVTDLEIALADTSQQFRLTPEVAGALANDRWHRLNRFAWEGSFFLLVLISGMAVLGRALREDARLRRRQQNFLAAVSHELKSPLANIRLSTETLQLRSPDAETRRRHLARILGNLYRMERMVVNLLDTARIETGSLGMEPETISIAAVADSVQRATEERARGIDAEVRFEVPQDLSVHANAAAVETVLHNLVENALESVSRCDGGMVSVSAKNAGNLVILEVRDDGCGFEDRESEKIFDKFYRPGDELSRSGRGSGLGLYIVRSIMSHCGGQVSAFSEGPGHGATFSTFWPRGEAEGI
jgi:signal transduction histidine kinase